MAYALRNKRAKNCCKQTIMFQVIIKDIVSHMLSHMFLEHGVVAETYSALLLKSEMS